MPIISAIQMTSSADLETNLASAASLLKEAKKQNANVAVLPEMFPLMGKKPQDKLAISEPFGQGRIQTFLAEQAKKLGLWIIGGTIPLKSDHPQKMKAACLVFNAEGEYVARYDKMHLFDVTVSATESYQESETIEPGKQVCVIDTPVGKVGIAVCYDIRFPELFRHLFNLGAEIFAIPAAFTVPTGIAHWEILTRSRAIENFSYLVGACQTGMHANGRSTYGHSTIVHPWGNILQSLPQGTGVISADIDLAALQQIRKKIPIKDHQTIFFDALKLKK